MIGKCVTCDHLNHALFGLPHLLSMPPLPELDGLKPWSNSFILRLRRRGDQSNPSGRTALQSMVLESSLQRASLAHSMVSAPT